jgi:hypothetical protein
MKKIIIGLCTVLIYGTRYEFKGNENTNCIDKMFFDQVFDDIQE